MPEADFAALLPPATSPFLSRTERDRRHASIRERMAVMGLDALILPAAGNRWEQSMADSRYVTGIGGFGTEALTIFPLEGEPTAYLFNRSTWWKSFDDRWIDDVRDGRNAWSENIVERIEELGLSRGTVGFAGLSGQTRTPNGVFPKGTYDRVRAALPQAVLADATSLVPDVRAVKSAEEIATLERSVAVAEAMAESMAQTATAGVSERMVYAALVHRLLVEGGELPSMLILASGPGEFLTHGQFVPSDRILEYGDLLVNEIEARVRGYGAQIVAPLWIGSPPEGYRAALEAAKAAFYAVLELMRPGTTIGDLNAAYEAALLREGRGRFVGAFPLMHARGLGDEIPAVVSSRDLERNRAVVLAENMTFILKPRALNSDGSISAQIGDTVQVTRTGGRRLGLRPLELAIR